METIERQIIIRNKQGLHARPAAIFVQIANKYESDIIVKKDDEEVNGKSIMGILMLAAEEGSVVVVRATGSDAKEAMDELEKILIKQTDNVQVPKVKKREDKNK